MEKSRKTRIRWERIMQSKGSFSDFEESPTVKSDSIIGKNTKHTEDESTTSSNIQTEALVKDLQREGEN